MRYAFSVEGHKNITSKHKTTLEFTKEEEVSSAGDCITGVNANFSLPEMKKLLSAKKVRITLSGNGVKDQLTAQPNKKFNDKNEIVIRKSNFISDRTFAINANKSASDLKPTLKNQLKTTNQISVEIVTI